MPRRKELKINLQELENGKDIFQLIKDDSVFEGYDLSTLTISIKASITPQIKDADKASKFLERYLVANPNCCDYFENIPYVSKQKLSRMMRVGRGTFDKWLNDKLITSSRINSIPELEIFNPYDILSQLKCHKKE